MDIGTNNPDSSDVGRRAAGPRCRPSIVPYRLSGVTSEQRYADLVRAFAGRPGVSQDGVGFGSSALKVGGKIFAMLSSHGEFVVKLPRDRVDVLVASGEGRRFDPGRGRLMKEWLALRPASGLDWASVAEEAMAFVGPEGGEGLGRLPRPG